MEGIIVNQFQPRARLPLQLVEELLTDRIDGDQPAGAGVLRHHERAVGGALEEEEYLEKIRAAGFQEVEVVGSTTYDEATIKALAGGCCSPGQAGEVASGLAVVAHRLAGRVSSVRVSAVKPSPKE